MNFHLIRLCTVSTFPVHLLSPTSGMLLRRVTSAGGMRSGSTRIRGWLAETPPKIKNADSGWLTVECGGKVMTQSPF